MELEKWLVDRLKLSLYDKILTMSFVLVSSVASEAWSTPEVEHVDTCGQSH